VPEKDLCKWAGHSNSTVYRRDVLRKLDREALVDYDGDDNTVVISPTGMRRVEAEGLLRMPE
jgi:hypothetical protein